MTQFAHTISVSRFILPNLLLLRRSGGLRTGLLLLNEVDLRGTLGQLWFGLSDEGLKVLHRQLGHFNALDQRFALGQW